MKASCFCYFYSHTYRISLNNIFKPHAMIVNVCWLCYCSSYSSHSQLPYFSHFFLPFNFLFFLLNIPFGFIFICWYRSMPHSSSSTSISKKYKHIKKNNTEKTTKQNIIEKSIFFPHRHEYWSLESFY